MIHDTAAALAAHARLQGSLSSRMVCGFSGPDAALQVTPTADRWHRCKHCKTEDASRFFAGRRHVCASCETEHALATAAARRATREAGRYEPSGLPRRLIDLIVAAHRPISSGELAKHTDIRVGFVNEVLKPAVKHGMVRRTLSAGKLYWEEA